MSLPSADDLFRPTAPAPAEEASTPAPAALEAPVEATPGPRKPSGRVRHDEKMTVYVTSDELMDLEHARLALRSRHGLAVDRGRLVRAAIALALSDLEAEGADGQLVRRLSEE